MFQRSVDSMRRKIHIITNIQNVQFSCQINIHVLCKDFLHLKRSTWAFCITLQLNNYLLMRQKTIAVIWTDKNMLLTDAIACCLFQHIYDCDNVSQSVLVNVAFPHGRSKKTDLICWIIPHHSLLYLMLIANNIHLAWLVWLCICMFLVVFNDLGLDANM